MWTLLPLATAPAIAQTVPVAFVGATLHPIAGPPVEDGVLIAQLGKIVAVGPRASTPIPPEAEVIDVSGKVILPGLVDTHSHIGSGGPGDLNERSGPLQAAVSSIDTVDPTHPSLDLARAGGITTVNVMPGSGNLIGGQTAYLKLRDAITVDAMLLCSDRRTDVCGGLKMANGTNPQGEGGYPRTRMGAAAQVREQFVSARTGASTEAPKKRKRKPEVPAPPKPDLDGDPLRQVMAGERIVHFHTHRADDIVTALSIGREFGFVPVLHHVSEGWKVAEVIAEAGAPCSVIVVDSPGGKEEAMELRLETAAALVAAGVPVALHTDDPITDSRLFLRSAGLAVRGGLSEADALAALTLNGAKMLGLEGRVGSLEPGKDADLVVLSGPPLSVWTHVEQTWVEGLRVFDRSDPVDLRYATGGYEVLDRYPAAEGRQP